MTTPAPYPDGYACPAGIPGALGWLCLGCGRAAGTYLNQGDDE